MGFFLYGLSWWVRRQVLSSPSKFVTSTHWTLVLPLLQNLFGPHRSGLFLPIERFYSSTTVNSSKTQSFGIVWPHVVVTIPLLLFFLRKPCVQLRNCSKGSPSTVQTSVTPRDERPLRDMVELYRVGRDSSLSLLPLSVPSLDLGRGKKDRNTIRHINERYLRCRIRGLRYLYSGMYRSPWNVDTN